MHFFKLTYFYKMMKINTKFLNYTHTWEQDVFENLYEKSSEKNNLKFGLSHFISVASSTYKTDIKIDNLQTISNYNVFRKGDIAFEGHTNSKYPFGRFVENTVGNGIISNIFSVFRPKTKYDSEYWKYAINNNSIMLKALKNSSKSGIMMNSLDIKELNKQIIVFPFLSEQTKIAKLLLSLDSVLSLHKRKYNFLKNIKNTLLDQMFPSQNSVIFPLKFEKVTHAWEQDVLENLATVSNG
ncbi:restriction endonuclease subunit S, partial [Mycoplasma sp. Z386]